MEGAPRRWARDVAGVDDTDHSQASSPQRKRGRKVVMVEGTVTRLLLG